nr:hypothetical protein [Thauera sp.]
MLKAFRAMALAALISVAAKTSQMMNLPKNRLTASMTPEMRRRASIGVAWNLLSTKMPSWAGGALGGEMRVLQKRVVQKRQRRGRLSVLGGRADYSFWAARYWA